MNYQMGINMFFLVKNGPSSNESYTSYETLCRRTAGHTRELVLVKDPIWDTWTKTGHIWKTKVSGGLTLASR